MDEGSSRGTGPDPNKALAGQGLASSAELLRRAREGDSGALDILMKRHLTPLKRWARGRLPRWARSGGIDTDDLVQETLLRTLRRIDDFEPRHDGALQAYLRQAVLHRVQDEVRRAKSRPRSEELSTDTIDPRPSPLEEAVGTQTLERYEAALSRLRDEDRQAVILRVEMRQGYPEISRALGKPSAEAARVAVARALLRLAKEMKHAR